MLVMTILANILGALIEVLILNTFLLIFGKLKRKWFLFFGAGVFIAINVLALMLIKNQIIFIFVTLLLIFAYSCLYNISNIKRIIAVIFVFVFVVIFEMLIGLLLGVITGLSIVEIQNNIILYLIGVVTSKLLMYGGTRILKVFLKPKRERLSILVIIPFVILPISTIFILYALSQYVVASATASVQIFVFILSLLLIISNLVVFLTYDIVLKQKEEKHLSDRQIMQFKLEQEYQKSLVDKQTESNKTIHDLKNKFYAIKFLLTSDNKAAMQEINSMCDIFDGISVLKITGIESVDALINSKKNDALKSNTVIEAKSLILNDYNFDPIDLCIIMGNLLDNSIEACEKIIGENKKISIAIIQQQNYLSITITNPIANNIETKVKEKTVKADKLLHGYGLDNVNEVVKKYNGIINYGVDTDIYTVNLILDVVNSNENIPIST